MLTVEYRKEPVGTNSQVIVFIGKMPKSELNLHSLFGNEVFGELEPDVCYECEVVSENVCFTDNSPYKVRYRIRADNYDTSIGFRHSSVECSFSAGIGDELCDEVEDGFYPYDIVMSVERLADPSLVRVKYLDEYGDEVACKRKLSTSAISQPAVTDESLLMEVRENSLFCLKELIDGLH